ncbi:hypothetical protein ACJ73_09405 [Blastomyces percursus]|uniref:Retrotransposon gag domain-containing protein n=1 Tax=Blastomyces percursus TaxID=1658174 RepID=A0A1J9P889_9EURO|nr:hypothetical protein ACJ73_09405 [Blastomyces percursus]
MTSSRPGHVPPGNASPDSHEANAFTAAQMAVLEQMFTRILDRVNTGSQDNVQQSNSTTSDQEHVPDPPYHESNHWKPSDIGFFYPEMPLSWGRGDTIYKDDKTYYRDINASTNRLRVAAITSDPAKIQVTRIDLIAHTNGVEEWCKALEKRFKISGSRALNKLQQTRFTIQDIRDGKSPTAYITDVINAAKHCGQAQTEYAQVLHAWNNLDVDLRVTMDEPSENTTVEEFMEIVRRKQVNWEDRYSLYPIQPQRPRDFSFQRNRTKPSGYFQERNQFYPNRNFSSNQNQYQDRRKPYNRFYQNQSQGQFKIRNKSNCLPPDRGNFLQQDQTTQTILLIIKVSSREPTTVISSKSRKAQKEIPKTTTRTSSEIPHPNTTTASKKVAAIATSAMEASPLTPPYTIISSSFTMARRWPKHPRRPQNPDNSIQSRHCSEN